MVNYSTNHNFNQYPKFRHNLWITPEDDPTITYLTVSHSTFSVPTSDASKFMQIRSHCTGHNTIEEIAHKSGVSVNEVSALINSLIAANILHPPIKPLDLLTPQEIKKNLLAACKIWGEQLRETHIINEIMQGKVCKNVVIGWLLETYHYIKEFPKVIDLAANDATGDLKAVLTQYAQEEQGHEEFITESLLHIGLSRQEIEQSIPLVSTRTINLLMRELFEFEPCSVLLVANIIEATDFEASQADEFQQNLTQNYQLSPETFRPFLEHTRIDAQLGHGKMLENHRDLLDKIEIAKLDVVVNKIHDLKHAFDLQKLEIKDYYTHQGNYFPRQFVDFFAI